MWLYRCDCGKEKVTQGNHLRGGDTKSCGCLGGRKRRLPFGLANMRRLIRIYKRHAKRRNLEWNLTEKQFAEITKKNCYYCGAKPNNKVKTLTAYGEYVYNGLDRINNNKGYTIDNVVPCCITCNIAKNTLTIQEFKEWIVKVYDKFKKKGGNYAR